MLQILQARQLGRTSRSMSTRAPDAPLRVDEVSTGDMKSKTSRIVVAKSRSRSSNLAVNTCLRRTTASGNHREIEEPLNDNSHGKNLGLS
eukprot:596430-Pleurochrysis_carterae.AAC.2